ncbi:MAG: RcpC/CpaB family pilus assembly protein [Phycisphaerales bacterium JB063]
MSQIPSSQSPPARGGSTQLVMIAGVVAVVAVILVNVYVELRAKANAEDTEHFFRLTVDRERGDDLSPGDFEMIDIPKSYIRAFGTDAIREDPTRAGIPAGGYEKRKFSVSARAGEVLRDGMFIRESTNRLGIDLRPGRRLVALPVNTENQPPNLAPDDYIDIYANVMRRSGTQSVVVMERVQVRLVGSRVVEAGADSSRSRNVKYGSITIEVDRDEVAKLANLQTRIAGGEFLVVVRAGIDRTLLDGDEEEGVVRDEIMEMLGLD